MNNNFVEPANIILTTNSDLGRFYKKIGQKERLPFKSFGDYLKFADTIKSDKDLFLSLSNSHILNVTYEFGKEASYPYLVIELLETIEYFESKLFNTVFEQIKDGRVKQTFYIAIGIGDNLDYWSPFNSFKLIGANSLTNYRDAKSIQLTFAPIQGLMDYSWEVFFANTKDLSFNNLSFTVSENLNSILYKDTQENLLNVLKYKLYKYPASKYINKGPIIGGLENLITKYLETVFQTKNVVTVFPKNLEKVASSFFESLIYKYLPYESDPDYYFDITKDVRSFFDKVKEAFSEGETKTARALRNLFIGKEAKFFLILRDFFENFGISVNFNIYTPYKPKSFTTGEGSVEQNIVTKVPISNFVREEAPTVFDDEYPIEFYFKDANLEVLISLSLPRYEKEKQQFIYNQIERLQQGLQQLFTENAPDIILYREGDTELLERLAKDIPGLEIDPTEPLVIFGDRFLIYNQIYGDSYKIPYEVPFEKDSELVREYIQELLTKTNNLYNSQKIETSQLDELLPKTSQEVSDFVAFKNYPVFRFNTKEANVISLEIEKNEFYFSFLNQSLKILQHYADSKELLATPQSNSLLTYNKEFSKFFNDYANNSESRQLVSQLKELFHVHIDNTAVSMARLRSFSSLEFGVSETTSYYDLISNLAGGELTEKEAQDAFNVSALYNEWVRATDANLLVSKIDDTYLKDPIFFFYDMLESLEKMPFTVTIQTLPFFPISNLFFLGKPVILLANRVKILGDTKVQNPLDNLLSGAYLITSISHEISKSDVSSKFMLTKLPLV